MKKTRTGFEVKRQSDEAVVVKFPTGCKVGKNINADTLLIALLKHRPNLEVEGQSGLCYGDGCLLEWPGPHSH